MAIDRSSLRLAKISPSTLAWALAAALVLPSAGLLAQGAVSATSQPTVDDQATISALAAQIKAEIQRLPADSSVETYEAAILFLVDQAANPVPISLAAFDILAADSSIPSNAQVAINNLRRTLARRRGTGAIPGGGTGFDGGGFSAPVISVGGGGSNYTQ